MDTDVRDFNWPRSWGLERKEIARTHCVRSVISSGVRELVEVVPVLEFYKSCEL
jgi:hypothetical protein